MSEVYHQGICWNCGGVWFEDHTCMSCGVFMTRRSSDDYREDDAPDNSDPFEGDDDETPCPVL